MNLIVVESPTKARTLSRFLGKDYAIEATMGHIKDLPKSKLGVDVDKDFAPDYSIVEAKRKSIIEIEKQGRKAGHIFLATDPDREGEAIAQHIYDVLRSDPKIKNQVSKMSRIVFHEITKEAVKEAINNPRKIDVNLVDAQIARRVLDRLVGYKVSPLLWKKVRRGLSAGRVQTVCVRLIVEREREIKAFVPKEYWEIYCDVSTQKPSVQKFTVKLLKIKGEKAEVSNAKEANRIVRQLKDETYRVGKIIKREVKRNPYPPFTTSTLTQSASRLFGWTAKRTMSVAQRLYEEGLITYHRTDSTNISQSAIEKTRSYIEEEFGKDYLPESPRFYKTKSKLVQEAHEAIRPTSVYKTKVGSQKVGKDMDALYNLIWKRFVSCQIKPSIYDETKIDVTAGNYILRASGQIMKFEGWQVIYGNSKKSNSSDDENSLPDVKEGEMLDLIKVDPKQKFTEPPSRFGEASLVKELEKLGIGRPSTYAPTISTIQARNYVEKVDRKFYPTPIGFAVNDFLIHNFSTVFDYSFTAAMEDDLDNVAHGQRNWVAMMKEFYKPFEHKLEATEDAKRVKIETEKTGRACPECKKGELVVRIGRFGKFISCSRFPECKYREKYVEKIGVKCEKCGKGDVIVKKTKTGRKFYGCSRYPKCDWASWRKPQDAQTLKSHLTESPA